MADPRVKVRVETDAQGAIAGIDAFTVAAGTALGNLATGALRMAADAFQALGREAVGWVNDAAQAEVAQRNLESALVAVGDYTPQLVEQYKALAEEFQKTSAVSADDLLPMMSKLVSVGGLQENQMKRAAQAAIDFAAATGKDLGSAFDIVAKAGAGNTQMLGRLGIDIKETGNKTADFEKVLKQLEIRFGGAGEMMAGTFQGQLNLLNETWGDVREELGGVAMDLLDDLIPALTTGAGQMKDFVSENHVAIIEKIVAGFGFMAQSVAVVGNAVALVIEGYGIMRETVAGMMSTLMAPIRWFIEAASKVRELEEWEKNLLALADGVELNVEDQKAFADKMREASDQVREQSGAIRDKLIGALAGVAAETKNATDETERQNKLLAQSAQNHGYVADAAENLKNKQEQRSAAEKRMAANREMIDNLREQEKQVEALTNAYQGLTASMSIGGGMTKEVDQSSKEFQALAKTLEGMILQGGARGNVAQGFLSNLLEGDVLALKQILAGTKAQADMAQAKGWPGASTLQQTADMLANLLSAFERLPSRDTGGPIAAGMAYRVHRDEEVIVPARDGMVIPAGGGRASFGRVEALLAELVAETRAGSVIVMDGEAVARKVSRLQARGMA